MVVESAHHHRSKGRLYSVHVNVTLPGGEVVVSHHIGRNPKKHDKVYAAMNDAFAETMQKLTRFNEIRRSDTKTHELYYDNGVVSNYFPDDGYGFLSTLDGTEIYFHRNAVEKDRFLSLDIGQKVRFMLASELGRKGPPGVICTANQVIANLMSACMSLCMRMRLA